MQDGKKTIRVHKILDDLEYVAQNMGGGGGPPMVTAPQPLPFATSPKKQLDAPPVNGGGGLRPKESESPVKREKEISELKVLVTRLTNNNQEMLGLLTERVWDHFILIQ